MNSPVPAKSPTNNLSQLLQQIGLRALPANLDDFLARAMKGHWSPHTLLEQVAQAEAEERSRRSLETRLRVCGIKKFKPMADYQWTWPTKIDRDVIERALTLDFLPEARNLVLVGRNGLGNFAVVRLVGGEDAFQELQALGGGRVRIAVECTARRHDGPIDIFAAAHRNDAGDFLGGGIDNLEFLGVDRVDPRAIDIKLPIVVCHCKAPSIAVTYSEVFY